MHWPSPPFTPARDSMRIAMLLVLRVLPSTTDLSTHNPTQLSEGEDTGVWKLQEGTCLDNRACKRRCNAVLW